VALIGSVIRLGDNFADRGGLTLSRADPTPLPGPPAWARQAACLGQATADHDPWHPPKEPASVRNALVAEAVAICAACPVQVACGRFGLELVVTDGGPLGIYGGMAPEALRDIARRIGRPTRQVAQHGTRARYVSRADPCRCEACRAANWRYEQARRVAKAAGRRDCPALTAVGKLCRHPARKGSVFCAYHAIPDQPAPAYEFG
jgi:Transcription factor WhiB